MWNFIKTELRDHPQSTLQSFVGVLALVTAALPQLIVNPRVLSFTILVTSSAGVLLARFYKKEPPQS